MLLSLSHSLEYRALRLRKAMSEQQRNVYNWDPNIQPSVENQLQDIVNQLVLHSALQKLQDPRLLRDRPRGARFRGQGQPR